jgi:hypothetical protein
MVKVCCPTTCVLTSLARIAVRKVGARSARSMATAWCSRAPGQDALALGNEGSEAGIHRAGGCIGRRVGQAAYPSGVGELRMGAGVLPRDDGVAADRAGERVHATKLIGARGTGSRAAAARLQRGVDGDPGALRTGLARVAKHDRRDGQDAGQARDSLVPCG